MLLVSIALAADPFAANARPCGGADNPLVPPPGHVIVVGSGFSREEAWENTLDNAVSGHGAGGNEARKAAIRRAVLPWCVTENPRGLRRETTWQGAIEVRWLGKLDAEIDDLGRQLDELSRTILTTAQRRSLVFEPTVWESGCVTDLGAHLNNEIRRRLGEYGGVGFAASGPRDDKHAFVQLRATAMNGQVSLSAAMELGNQSRLLPGLAFSLDLFGFETGEDGRCATNQALGLPGDQVTGHDGLVATIDPGVLDGVACQGDRHHLVVTASKAADVHVFSVDQGGNGYHVFDGRVAAGVAVDLGEVEMVPVPDQGDERLVVVASPVGASTAPLAKSRGVCELPAPFTARLAGPAAAIGTATFKVIPSGVDGCPVAATQAATATLQDAALCW